MRDPQSAGSDHTQFESGTKLWSKAGKKGSCMVSRRSQRVSNGLGVPLGVLGVGGRHCWRRVRWRGLLVVVTSGYWWLLGEMEMVRW